MVSLFEKKHIVHILAKEKLNNEDYERIIPLLKDNVEQHAKCNILFKMDDFKGSKPQSLWNELKFDLKHTQHLKKIALVGEKKWQKSMADIVKCFDKVRIEGFDEDEVELAEDWILS